MEKREILDYLEDIGCFSGEIARVEQMLDQYRDTICNSDAIKISDAKYIKVKAGNRYWEDAEVNGVEDTDGTLIPFRNGDYWYPVIELKTGQVQDWPSGMTANIHYKVCDDGEYWLLDEQKKEIAKWSGHYVPDKFLCHGDEGYGDYIIFKVGGDGKILGYHEPEIDESDWAMG